MSAPAAMMERVPRPPTPLVGRAAPLAALTETLERAVEGTAGAVVLSGDAGVGKTRLLAELVTAVGARDVTTLVGHCLDFGDTALPFLPFTEVFGRLADDDPERVQHLVTAHPAVSRLLPSHRRGHAVAVADGALTDGRVDRSALFEAVTASLDDLAQQAPVLLVLEDVHWADQSTRDLVGFVLARLADQRLGVVVSYRSDDLHRRHPLRRLVGEWTRLPRVDRVDLSPLADTDVAALARALRPELDPVAVRSVVARADGNAFYAEELVSSAGDGTAGGAVPPDLADLLLVRVDRLSVDARQVARVLAVAGRPTPHDLVGAVAQVSGAALDDALREAVDAHLVEPRGTGYAFRHALMGEAVDDDLLPGERVRLHAAFTAALRADPSLGPDAELALHAHASHDLPTAFAAGVRAGDEALGVGAPAEAARHYELALELVDRVPGSATVRPRWALVVDAADAHVSAGFPERARALVEADLGRDDDTGPLGRAELLYHGAWLNYLLDDRDDAGAQIAQARALLAGRPPSVVEAKVLGLHARMLDSYGRWHDAVAVAEQAVAVAEAAPPEQAGDAVRAATDARSTLVVLHRRRADPADAARDLGALADRAREEGVLSVELRSRHNLGTVLYESGDLPGALAAYAASAALARRTGQQWSPFGASSLALHALVLYESGRWDEALAVLDLPDAPPYIAPSLVAVASLVRAARGDDDATLARSTRDAWTFDPQIAVMSAAAEAESLARLEGLAAGQRHLGDAIETIAARWGEPLFLARLRMTALAAGLAADHVASRPAAERDAVVRWARPLVEHARRSATETRPDSGRLGPEGLAWAVRLAAEWARLRWAAGETGPVPSVHAPPAAAPPVATPAAPPSGESSSGEPSSGEPSSGEPSSAESSSGEPSPGEPPVDATEFVALWERTVAAFDYGPRYELTRARVHLAEAQRAVGDLDAATRTAAIARADARDLGARPLLDRLAALAVPRRATTDPAGRAPTAREHEVLGLIADGRTNRQIARALFISEKTVSVHVSNVLAKLGAASRTEAAAIARREGLLD